MCVFLISPVPIAEPLTSELIDTPVFHNLAPRPIKYRVSVPIPIQEALIFVLLVCKLNELNYWSFSQYEQLNFFIKMKTKNIHSIINAIL